MTADRLSEELELFIEDSQEQLTYMEEALMQIQEQGSDDENIGALFRAMHTIKGTAGMFGFDEVVNFTHVGENLLSEVRNGAVDIGDALIDIFLQVKDHTHALIELAIENEKPDARTSQAGERLIGALTSYMPGVANKYEESLSQSDQTLSGEDTHTTQTWHISIRLKAQFFTGGQDLIDIINYLHVLGRVENMFVVTCNIPPFSEMNPTEAYLGYEILFETDFGRDALVDVFEFVRDDIELDIFASDDRDALSTLLHKRRDKIDLKDQLLFYGFYTASDFGSEVSVAISDEVAHVPIQKAISSDEAPSEGSKEKKGSKKSNFTLRVDSTKIDQLINQISEMVIANAKIAQRADVLDDTDLSESAEVMSDMLEEIRTGVMNMRMVPVGDSFNKFKRIVRDVARKLDKEIDFEIVGGDNELDKMVVEKISDPIMHMLRNSIDHGIEMPDDRIKAGKPAAGKVILNTYPDAGTIVIEIKDDGKGLDKEKILQKAIANGLVSKEQHLCDKEIFHLIFEAGLSTAQEVSDISGRGVGMDVVKQNIESLRGTIEIDSKQGEGSTFTIRLPLTLAIIDGFLVQSGDTKYIVPLDMIQECIELDHYYKRQMKDDEFINLRDTMLPLLDIRSLYHEAPSRTRRENVVVVRYGDYRMGLRVDELFGEFQTVIKPLGEVFKNVPGISGGTLLGSGEIALIFDIPKLIEYKIKHTI